MLSNFWRLEKHGLRARDVLLSLSCAAMTLLMSWRGGFGYIALGAACSLAGALFVFSRARLWDAALGASRAWLAVAAVFALTWDIRLVGILQGEYAPIVAAMKRFTLAPQAQALVARYVPLALGVLAAPMLFCLLAFALPRLWRRAVRFAHGLCACERRFVVIGLIVGVAAIVVCYSLTNCFYLPRIGGELIEYDVVYTADTGVLVNNDVYVNVGAIQNDINQMLFGPLAAPLGVAARLISWLLFFVPDAYAYALAVLQLALMLATAVLLCRLTGLRGAGRALFLAAYALSYPFLLFALNLEQYVLSVFLLVAFVYAALRDRPERDALFVGAVGTLMTGAVLFPIATKRDKLARMALSWLEMAACYVLLVAVFGKLPYLLRIFSKQGELMGWYGGASLGLGDKLLQFVTFAGGCLFAPASMVDTASRAFPRYVLCDAAALDPVGLCVLALAALGLWLNRKSGFARVCGCWALFSFALLPLMGWGTVENGLVLYSLYFGWAYLCLCWMALDVALKRLPRLRLAVQGALVAALAIVNAPALLAVVRFGMQYYRP